jgi:hypothetical protein
LTLSGEEGAETVGDEDVGSWTGEEG